jgi:hypothetical protein
MTTSLNFEKTNRENTNGKQVLIAETKNFTFEIRREGKYAILSIWDDNGKIGSKVYEGLDDYSRAMNAAEVIEYNANL